MITKANIRDLEAIDRLTIRVVQDMKTSGIPQWNYPYPRYKVFYKDMVLEGLYVDKKNDQVRGVMTLLEENDPAYQILDTWQGKHSLVIHRLMVDPSTRIKGIASSFLGYACELAKMGGYDSIKIDTHEANYKMRNFLTKHGFKERGYLPSINRLAYELVLEESI